MKDWFEKALELYKPNEFGYSKIAKELNIPLGTVSSRFCRYFKKQSEENAIDQEQLLKFIRKHRSIDEIASKFKCRPVDVELILKKLKDESHYNILRFGDNFKLETVVIDPIGEKCSFKNHWDGNNKNFIFGICGDVHENSKYVQLTYLHEFYDICYKEGVRNVYNAGDIDEGEQMRPGHQYECYSQGADEHCANIVRNYPKKDGLKTWFITGNHDHSMIKHCGFNIGKSIAEKRPDMNYLGSDVATIEITPNCKLELRHPSNGTAYAISYHTQKMIESFYGGEKPNILAVGHYHKAEYLVYRNVHALQTGTFQGQTPWMKNKGIAAMVGGWIIEMTVNDDGQIQRFTPTFFPFYKTIEDDWKNWYKII